MNREAVIKAVKVKESAVAHVWDGHDEEDRPATPQELARALASAQKRGRLTDSGVKGWCPCADENFAA
jgi:hypothetical protein